MASEEAWFKRSTAGKRDGNCLWRRLSACPMDALNRGGVRRYCVFASAFAVIVDCGIDEPADASYGISMSLLEGAFMLSMLKPSSRNILFCIALTTACVRLATPSFSIRF